MYEYIKKISKILCFIIVIFLSGNFVSAAERISTEKLDCDEIKIYPKYDVGNADMLRKEGKTYVFTKKSAGKMIPIKIDTDGVMVYCFNSEEVGLLDGKKKIVVGRMDDEGLGVDYVRHEENLLGVHRFSRPIKLTSVKKDETYYIQIPQNVPEEGYEVYAYLRPKCVKMLESGKVYMSEGTGEYVYYPFKIRKKSLAGLYIDGVFCSYEGGDTMYFKVQKKIKGKWRDITPLRSKLASLGQCGKTAPYGLSKGNYRFGVKVKKGQIAYINVDIRKKKYKNSVQKKKAIVLKKGKNKEGIFTWEDKKSHWYKVTKSNKNKVKRITMYAGCAVDKIDFTIYKKGMSGPIKTVCMRGKDRIEGFVKYVSKSYTLRDNGTYFIKVSKADKKTNGAYKIKVK